MKSQKHQFGPWTTTLHHSSQLELSAFWRRRLGRLESLATRRPRLSWVSAATLCALAGALLILPRLQLDTTARAEESSPTSATTSSAAATSSQEAQKSAAPQASQHDENRFTATFSNGVKVQLIGLSENPSKAKPWWAPDGEQLKTAPYARVPALMHPADGRIAREVCWRWLNLPPWDVDNDDDGVPDNNWVGLGDGALDPSDFETKWQILPSLGGCGGGIPFDENSRQIEGLTAWAIMPESNDTCTIRLSVSIAATKWKTVFTNQGRNLSSMGGTIDGVRQGAIFGEPYSQDGGTSITVSYLIPDKAVRLLAFGHDGRPEVGTSKGGAGAVGFSQTTYHFSNSTPEQFQRFELQSQQREFESVEFRNVSLHPNNRTEVEIVRLKPEEERPQSSAGATTSVRGARRATR
jgi:hypothetical protein